MNYICTVTNENSQTRIYIGNTKVFKRQYRIHINSFNKLKHRISMVLTGYRHILKLQIISYTLMWSNIDQASPCKTTIGRCQLCIKESYIILCIFNSTILNKFSDVIHLCNHGYYSTFKNRFKFEPTQTHFL